MQILTQNRLSKTIRYILSEPLKCILYPMNINPYPANVENMVSS